MLSHPVARIKAFYATREAPPPRLKRGIIEKYRELIDNGYIFQPVAFEVQGSLGESSENFITRLCKMLCCSRDDQQACNFLKQRISVGLKIGNAACVLGTVSDRDALEEIHFLKLIFKTSISLQFQRKFSTGQTEFAITLFVFFTNSRKLDVKSEF